MAEPGRSRRASPVSASLTSTFVDCVDESMPATRTMAPLSPTSSDAPSGWAGHDAAGSNRKDANDAAGNGRSGAHGSRARRPPDPGGSRLRGFRPEPGSSQDDRRLRSEERGLDGRSREEARQAAGDLVDGACGDHGPARGRSRRAARARRHHHRRRQQLLPRRRRPCSEAEAQGHPLRGRGHERRRLRPRAWLLPDDRWRGRRRAAPRPHLQDDRARRRVGRADAGSHRASRHRPRTATCTAGRPARATS